MMSVLGVVLARMAVLTVFRGNELRRRADENRILIRKIPAPRGIIFDRNSKALTRNVRREELIRLVIISHIWLGLSVKSRKKK